MHALQQPNLPAEDLPAPPLLANLPILPDRHAVVEQRLRYRTMDIIQNPSSPWASLLGIVVCLFQCISPCAPCRTLPHLSMQKPSYVLEQAHISLTALLFPDSVGRPQHASPTPCRSRIASCSGCRPCSCSLGRALVADVVFTGSIQAEHICGFAVHMVACYAWCLVS